MFKVKALYDYASGHEDDLEFRTGQIITVTDEEDADWYGGEFVDDAGVKHEGIFPRNFVEKYEPTAPPRPTRARPKKEPAPEAPVAAASASSPPQPPKAVAPKPEDAAEDPAPASPPSEAPSAPPPVPVSVPAPAPVAEPPAPKAVATPPAAPPPVPVPAPKPAASTPKPPVAEKPVGSSLRDKIAAFNKASAPPITPFKPAGLSAGSSGFIKKPFVAPPPSRNAYVPPPTLAPVARIYRRDEDPDVKEQEAEARQNATKAGLVPTAGASNEGEAADDQPKLMSLKERLALLQKEQQETAARHAEAAAKKEKPKKPPKKRLESQESAEGAVEGSEETRGTSTDEPHPPRLAHPPRRRSSKGTEPHDGNEADMSGAGETTEGVEDVTEKDESDGKGKHPSKQDESDRQDEEEEEDEDEDEDEEDDIDPEIRRREEVRARMAKISGGMGMPGLAMPALFGAPAPVLPKKKKEKRAQSTEEPASPLAHPPPVPLPGLMRPPPPPEPKQPEPKEEAEEESEDDSRHRTPHQEPAPPVPSAELGAPPPIPGGRPAPPPVPADSRPPPPLPDANAPRSPSEGSASDDELSERPREADLSQATRPPPPVPGSPRASQDSRASLDDTMSGSPPPDSSRRHSRPPPPIPGAPPAPPAQTRPPPPPPPVPAARSSDDGDEEITAYEGDYDTDIASSVPHKDALKSHQRESSFDEGLSPRSPTTEAPPPPVAAPPPPVPVAAPPPPVPVSAPPPPVPVAAPPPPAGPPPIPSQSAPEVRRSLDAPSSAPPPPPPQRETPRIDDDYDPYNYNTSAHAAPAVPSYPAPSSPPQIRQHHEDTYFHAHESSSYGQAPRSPPPPPPSGRGPSRHSADLSRPAYGRRSVDVTRPSMESGFVANDIDLASQSGWWLQPNGLPPQLHGRGDIFFESDESSSADPHQGGKTLITRDIYVLFQDYSQTVITVRFDPHDASDVHLEQRHEPPPRALRQDQLEQSYERFGRAIADAAAAKKDTVVGDGTPQALIHELLRPFPDALLPVGTRAYGALVYWNRGNASTTQNDEIRPGDIVSIRNAKFQGKHGAMHAKYSMEVGKPDHVAVVAEWDGTKKKVRAWEQGRESKKVKLESFKLDDLRSGEVKIWRVMPRSWVGWESPPAGGSSGGN
ncbi:hypothetical protein VTJ49DRAFT_5122 [Mycothermus thermophilus]|uniref:SH3 domain-containing protein n=1 Tax=Humicola insolens TaxID=85995 RepID=A0ABR3V4G4_HUMIN